ncbi:hypothetical protein [Bradyrhizobium sp. AZCC 1693]|uniref:hypothetical protein n=1 Tax=Bradyrhizobium sp. AZCC 1693 TaxID=3117029 RepID=UPI002FEE8C36
MASACKGQNFRDADLPGIEFIKADLSLMREAQRVARLLPAEELDLVIFTTGIMAGPTREVTGENIERDMAISYLSRRVVVREIGPRLGMRRPAAQMKPRVFIMGFPGKGQAGKLDDLNAEKSYGSHRARERARSASAASGQSSPPPPGFNPLVEILDLEPAAPCPVKPANNLNFGERKWMNPTCPGTFWSERNAGGRRCFRIKPCGRSRNPREHRSLRPTTQGSRPEASQASRP